MNFRVQIQIRRLAVEIVLLNDMHCIVVATSENVHLVRVLTVLSSFERWHLQIKAIKDALLVVCVLQLYVFVQVVLDA